MTIQLDGIEGVRTQVGRHLGDGDWVQVTQERVDKFAEATGDHQWIHVDVERAKAGPFGGTIAHGYLTLSMIADLTQGLFEFHGFRMGVNYGLEKVRFPAPVPVGSRIRVGVSLLSAAEIAGGIQTTLEFTVELEGSTKPACVAQMVMRHTV
jgi:acyl dehydratase